jgi:hypothetical protein
LLVLVAVTEKARAGAKPGVATFLFNRLDFVGASTPGVGAVTVIVACFDAAVAGVLPRFQTLATSFLAEDKNPNLDFVFGARP